MQNAAFYARVFDLTTQRVEGAGIEYYTLHQGDAGRSPACCRWTPTGPASRRTGCPTSPCATSTRANAVVQAHGGKLLHGPIPSPYGRIMVVSDPQGAVLSYMSAT